MCFYKTSVETLITFFSLVTFFSTRGKSEGDLVGGLREYCCSRLEHSMSVSFLLDASTIGYIQYRSPFTPLMAFAPTSKTLSASCSPPARFPNLLLEQVNNSIPQLRFAACYIRETIVFQSSQL